MAKNKFNAAWLQRHLTDPYVKQAQIKGYRSRAAFKLTEIDEKDRLLRPGMTVVDLGSTPGSWSQVVRERLSAKGRQGIDGRIIALDLLPMDPIADVQFLLGDFREEAIERELSQMLEGEKVDLVLSDMAPNMSGVAVADAARVMHVCELALEFAQKHLKPQGALVVKTFQGSGFTELVAEFKRVFRTVHTRKPGASRAESSELFLVGRDLRVV
ncbi:MAG: RlmE family RNA methyltransferase [Burkholderiaceae bacterium]